MLARCQVRNDVYKSNKCFEQAEELEGSVIKERNEMANAMTALFLEQVRSTSYPLTAWVCEE